MDLQNFLQDERKKKFLIISGIALVVIIGGIFIFTKKPATPTTNQDGQTQLLNDLAQLTPRDGVAQDQNRLVAPLVKVSADVPVVAPGQSSVISWNATNATSCVDGNGNALRTSGSMSITPVEKYTLDVVCTNAKGTTIESITVDVTTTPIITLTASPEEVLKGEQSFISWTTVNTTRCVDAQGKTLRLSGGIPVAPQAPYTFEISCTGPNGTDKKSVTVGIITVKPTDRYVYVFKSKATATSATKSETFQTSEGCQSAYNASTAYQKSECVKVAVGTTTGSGSSSSGSDSAGGVEILTCITITQNLASGSTDAKTEGEVTVLQKFLVRKGLLSASITGTFGPATESAVKAFQTSAGLPSTGIVDAATQAEIKKVSCADAEAAAKKAADEKIGTNQPPTGSATSTVGEGTIGPKITLSLDPDTIGFNELATLTWNIKDAQTCTLSTIGGDVVAVVGGKSKTIIAGRSYTTPDDIGFSGSYNLKMNGAVTSVTFKFRCDGNGMRADNQKTVTWDVSQGGFTGPATIDDLTAEPTAIAEASVGNYSVVTWTAYNAQSCKVSADAYAEIYNDDTGWKSLKGMNSAAKTSGQVRVKPGYEGSQVPYSCHQVTSGCENSGGDYCYPTTSTVCSGDNSRMSGGGTWNPQGNNPPATVTVSCTGPIKPDPRPKSISVTITPTPPSGDGGGW